MSDTRHPLVQLAAEAVRTFVLEQRGMEPPAALLGELPWAVNPAAAFVSLKRAGALRGCVGTVEPTKTTLLAEVIHSAIGAATRDPRFPAVQREELEGLAISVDVLTEPEPVRDPAELDHRRYGIIVRTEGKQGVLLPNIDGIDSVDDQLAAARRKAGVVPERAAELLRFEVRRYY